MYAINGASSYYSTVRDTCALIERDYHDSIMDRCRAELHRVGIGLRLSRQLIVFCALFVLIKAIAVLEKQGSCYCT